MSWINLGNKIKQYRKLNNITQQELANKLGIARSTLSYYEKGEVEPNIYTLLKLSEIMNCSLDFLFDIETNSYHSNYSNYLNNKPNNHPKNNDNDIKILKKLIKKLERSFIEIESSKKRLDLIYEELKRTQNRLFKIDDFFTKLDNIEDNRIIDIEQAPNLKNTLEEFADEIAPNISLIVKGDTREKVDEVKFRSIPCFNPIAAGNPSYALEDIVGFVDIPESKLNSFKEYFSIPINGDSMNKLYDDGESLLVEKTNVAELNDLVIALLTKVSNEATFKKFSMQDNKVYLIPMSTNPIHKVQTYNCEDVKVLGKVIGKVADFLK